MTLYKLSSLPLFLFILQGCSSAGVNPNDANIFQATHGVTSGEFQRQTDRKRAARDRSRQELDRADADNRALNSEFASLQNEKARLDKDLNTITVQNQSLQRSISAMRVQNATDKSRQLKAQSRLAGLNKQVNQLKSQRKNISVGRYKQRISELKRDIEGLKRSL